MSYGIMCKKPNSDEVQFLADRHKTRDCWWTTDYNLVMLFEYEGAAVLHCRKLNKGNPEVIRDEFIRSMTRETGK